jgi:hypothetical protein
MTDRWLVFEVRLVDGSTVRISRAGGVTRGNLMASLQGFFEDARAGNVIPVAGGREAGYPHVNAAHIVHLCVIDEQRDERLGGE